jgi:hypothetical protein
MSSEGEIARHLTVPKLDARACGTLRTCYIVDSNGVCYGPKVCLSYDDRPNIQPCPSLTVVAASKVCGEIVMACCRLIKSAPGGRRFW